MMPSQNLNGDNPQHDLGFFRITECLQSAANIGGEQKGFLLD